MASRPVSFGVLTAADGAGLLPMDDEEEDALPFQVLGEFEVEEDYAELLKKFASVRMHEATKPKKKKGKK